MASHDIFAGESRRLTDLLRVLPGSTVDLSSYDTRATSGYAGRGKKDAEALRLAMGVELADLQERLFADGRSFPNGRPACSSCCRAWTPPAREGP